MSLQRALEILKEETKISQYARNDIDEALEDAEQLEFDDQAQDVLDKMHQRLDEVEQELGKLHKKIDELQGGENDGPAEEQEQ